MPKSYAVADSPSKVVVLSLGDALVRLSGFVTEPLELCTETGCSVRDLGARMYSSEAIADDEATYARTGRSENGFILMAA
jgi:hypothetical protein